MNTVKQAREALARVLNNQHSSFYRDLYASKGFDAAAVAAGTLPWIELPYLSKPDIIATPAAKQFFLPMSQTQAITFTSGTSGKGIVVMPRDLPPPSPLGKLIYPGKRTMAFFYYTYTSVLARGENEQMIVSGDPRRFDTSAKLALQMDADSLLGMPSVLIAFAKHLPKEARAKIIQLNLQAERLSRLQDNVLYELYPNANHGNLYASRELGLIAHRYGDETPSAALMRPWPSLYMELLDENGAHGIDELTDVAEGELVATIVANTPFPFMRYRTGDRIRVHPTGQAPLIEVLGRAEEERVSIPGGQLVLAELERAIPRVFGGTIADFECTVRETLRDGAVVTSMSIVLFSHTDLALAPDARERLARELHVNRERTWQDGVERGLYMPMACTLAPTGIGEGKRKNIIDARG